MSMVAAAIISSPVWLEVIKKSEKTPEATPPQMLPIESDQNGTVDRCVMVSGTGRPKKGHTFIVGVHLHQDEGRLKNKRTYFPTRPVLPPPSGEGRWHVEPALAIGPVGRDTSTYDIFLASMPEEQASILLNDMSATRAHNLDEMADRGIEILQTKMVNRRPSGAAWCS